MKIIISNYDSIKNPYYGGGGAMATHEIAKRLAKEHKIKIICGAYKNSRDQTIEGVEYKHIGSKMAGPKLAQVIFSSLLPIYAMREKHDIWVENFVPPHSTNFIPLFTKKPVVGVTSLLNAEEFSQKYKLPFHLIEKFGLKTYKNMIALNEEFKKRIKFLSPSTDVRVIPRGVDKEFLSLKTNEKDYVLYLGRIDVFQKGLDLLIEAWSKVAEKNKDVKLVIAGTGTVKDKKLAREIVKKYKLSKSVQFKEWVDGKEKMKMLSQSICVVCPSRFEGFSNTALETLAAAKCLVCFDIEGLKWVPTSSCLKVKPFDTKLLADTIVKMLKNKKLRFKKGNIGKQFVRSFDWNNIVKKYEDYFEEINKRGLLMKNSKRQTPKFEYLKQVDKSHYEFERYLPLERWISYYHQIKSLRKIAEILGKKDMSVLEIGIGDGNVSSVLKNMGFKITTIDIDKELNPDHVGYLPKVNIKHGGKFDCILCCEVLEHIRYEDAEKSLASMAKKTKYSVISVPHKSLYFSAVVKIPILKPIITLVQIPANIIKHHFEGQHYWELGTRSFSVGKFKISIENAGFKILNDYRITEFPYHHLFILKSTLPLK